MNIIIMGLPGSGKGTQSDLIVEKYEVTHLSTGNLFRAEMASGSNLGSELSEYINNGNLVPDELTIRLLKEEISKEKYKNGFLLDGFPRTLPQAVALKGMLEKENIEIDHVLNLDLAQDIIIQRLSGRLFCPMCQKTYHKLYNQPIEQWICDDDKTKLIQREDDAEDKVKNRLKISNEQMGQMLSFYDDQNKLTTIKMSEADNVEVIFNKVVKVLND